MRTHLSARRPFPDACRALLLAALFVLPLRAAEAQVVEAFPVTNGPVYSTAVSGGTLYIGGAFTSVGPYTGSGVPVDAGSGAAAAAFPKVDGPVLSTIPDGAGGYYIGGSFTRVGGLARRCVARVRGDGSVDASFDAGVGADCGVLALAVSGTRLYLGGEFTTVGGQARANLAAVDATTGALDAVYDHSTDEPVLALASGSGLVYVGGQFTTVGGVARAQAAALDAVSGALDGAFDPAPNAVVWSLAATSDGVYLGGNFTEIGGEPHGSVARVRSDGTVDAAFTASATIGGGSAGYVLSLALSGGHLYLGGAFFEVGGAPRSFAAAVDATTGAVDPTFVPDVDAQVLALAVTGGTVYLGGAFSTVGGAVRGGAVAVHEVTGAVDAAFDPSVSDGVRALAVSGGTVYLGGFFSSVGMRPRNHIAALDLASGALDAAFDPDANEAVRALGVSGGRLYLGGDFTEVGGQTRTYAAAVDLATGALDGAFDADVGGSVYTLAVSGGKVYLGGEFTTVGGTARQFAAAVDAGSGALDGAFDPEAGSFVYAIAASGGRVYLGGAFDTIGGQPRNSVAAFDEATGALDGAFDPDADASVRVLVVNGGTVYLGGYFEAIGGTPRNRVAAVDALTGVPDPAFDADADDAVLALALDGGTLYLGGAFETVGGQARSRVAAVDAASGALDGGFDPSTDDAVTALAVSGTRVYIGGDFTYVGAGPRAYLAAAAVAGTTTPTRTITATTGLGNDQGWRVLAMPVSGATRADLEDDVTFEASTGSVLYTHTGGSGGSGDYTAVTASATPLPGGRGFVLYLFDSAAAPFTTDKTLDVTGVPPSADVVVSGFDTGDLYELLGNPFDASFDLSSMDLAASGFQASAQIWNPRTNAWVVVPQDAGGTADVLTSWQGFFVERTTAGAGATGLTLPYAGRTTGGVFVGKGGEVTTLAGRLDLRTELRDGAGTRLAGDAAAIELRTGALDGWDAFDASKLDPLSGAFATLALGGLRAGATRDGAPWWQALRSLPNEGMTTTEVPLRVETSTGGAFTLAWGAAPGGLRAELVDRTTGTRTVLSSAGEVRLDLASATIDSTRFVLRLTPGGATGTDAVLAASAFMVSPVWPNPTRGASARLVVRVGTPQNVRVEVYDALGRVVAVAYDGQVSGAEEVALPVGALASGVYVVRVTGAGAPETRRFTVVR